MPHNLKDQHAEPPFSNDNSRSFSYHDSQNNMSYPGSSSFDAYNVQSMSPRTLQKLMESDKDFDDLFDSNLDNVMVANSNQFASSNPWLFQHLKAQQQQQREYQNNDTGNSSIPYQETMREDLSSQYTMPFTTEQGPNAFDHLSSSSREYQDILFSDPSFIQQQQTLQDHQRRMQEQILAQEAQNVQYLETSPGDTATQYSMSPPAVSNLSAMFSHNSGSKPSASEFSHGRSPSEHQTVGKQKSQQQEQKRLSQPVQGGVRITLDAPDSTRKDLAGRRGSPSLSLGSFPNSSAPPSPLTSNVDHQKRQGDFQARFKVNYARKASLNSQQQANMLQPSLGSLQDMPIFKNPFASLPTTPAAVTQDMPNPIDDMSQERRRSISLPPNANNNNNNRVTIPGTPPTTTKAKPIPIGRVSRPHAANISIDAEEHHRRLDEQLQKVNFDDITVSELKEMLRQRGKPATGKKATLIQRLMDERDMVNAIKNGVAIPHSNASSFTAGSPINSSSVPNASPVIGSPFSQIQKSIAAMSIGSPPTSAHSRRFSPYGAPKSPRLGPAHGSPKMLSTSVPSASSSSNQRPHHHHHTNSSQFVRHSQHASLYAPFVPSGLGTPDTELENPFDTAIDQNTAYQGDSSKEDQMMENYGSNITADPNFTSNLHDLLQQGYAIICVVFLFSNVRFRLG
ncbi:hypothetical protein BGW37DRAFT_490642 [Umbelopsis sp. PMI_123]|nr:hypothetical protein BGW37DRAFT_490642 [Umbelopsis sp. PMI_123]